MYKTLWNEVMTDRRIEYRFLHWGPFVCNYTLLPEEVANTILFLASNESTYTTGTEIYVDGALSLFQG